jgi:hypothetical protein
MSAAENLPPLGPQQGWDARTCQRAIGEWSQLCGKPGAWHIIWDATCENAVACDRHAAEALEPWHALQVHPLRPDCTMPGSEWVPEERRCVFPGEPVEMPAALVEATA